MTIDWTHFTPGASLAGGLLLGLCSVIYLLLNGRILGASGILAGLLPARPADALWRLCFLAGVLLAPWVWMAGGGRLLMRIEASNLLLIAGGLLVGIGTRLAGGCTSGHGVGGLSRRSPRSLVATLCFMATGFAAVFILRHLIKA